MSETTDTDKIPDDKIEEMEEIEMAELTSHDTDKNGAELGERLSKLAEDVEELVDLTMQINEANKGLKIIRARKKELNSKIMEFMQLNGFGVINLKSGAKIQLSERTKLGKVDRSYLEETLAAKVGRDAALELMSFAYENRSSEKASSVRIATKK